MEATTVYFMSSVTRILISGVTFTLTVAKSVAFSDNMTSLGAKKLTADGYIMLLEDKTSGITTENLSLKRGLSIGFSIAGSLISAHGASIGDGELTAMDRYTFSELYRTKPDQVTASMASILAVIEANKVALAAHGITAPIILKLKAYNTAYSGKKENTKIAIDVHKDTKKLLDALIVDMKKDITTQMDKNAEFFRFDDMEYYLTYTSARKIAHHHMHDKTPVTPDATTGNLALTAMNKATGELMSEVEFAVLSINYIAKTDINGEIAKDKLLPGEYTGTLSCPGFATINFTFNINIGEFTELGFMMEAVA